MIIDGMIITAHIHYHRTKQMYAFKRLVSSLFLGCFQTPMRLVPNDIQRPDYADHPLGKIANPFTHNMDHSVN